MVTPGMSDLYNRVAVVLRRGKSKDGYGGTVDDFSITVLDALPCRVSSPSKRARFKASLQTNVYVSTVVIFCDYHPDPNNSELPLFKERDRLAINGVNYDIDDVVDPELIHHHLELNVTVVK